MHKEAQRLDVLNKKMRSDLKMHITKLASTQSELDKLRQENEKLVSNYKAIGCVCTSTSLNMDDYKSLQNKFEKLKKDHYAKREKGNNNVYSATAASMIKKIWLGSH